MRASITVALSLSLVCLLAPHGSAEAQGNVLDQDDVELVDSVGTNTIWFHRNTASVNFLKSLIIDRVKRAVSEIRPFVEVTDVEFRVLVFPERTLPSKGMSGVAPDEQLIYILLDPEHPRLRKSLDEELVAVIAHEYHHTLRHRTVGSVANLFEAMVNEGLADHFCMEVTGEDPPWATPMTDEDLAVWRAKAEKEWFNPDFDYFAWFVGIGTEIPRGAGYSIGRRIVADYLASHPTESPSTLYATRAREFLTDARQPPDDNNAPKPAHEADEIGR